MAYVTVSLKSIEITTCGKVTGMISDGLWIIITQNNIPVFSSSYLKQARNHSCHLFA